MADIEKVKAGIYEMLLRCSWDDIDKERHRFQPVLNDAIELLKEQQPKKPHYRVLRYLVNGQVIMIDHPECPKCFENGFRLYEAEIEKGQKYCKRCGQAIDWSKDGEKE